MKLRSPVQVSFASMVSLVGCMLFNPLNPPDDLARGGSTDVQGGFANSSGGVLATGGVPSGAGGMTGGVASASGGVTTGAGAGSDGGSGGVTGFPTTCTRNEDCNADPDVPALCRASERRCVALASDTCRVVGNPSAQRALFFGAFAPFGGTPAAATIRDTYQLAFDDFALLQGLPTASGRQSLVMVQCNNEGGADVIDAGMRHLIDDVRVPAILATVSSDDLQRNFESDYGNRTFYLSPQKVSEEFAKSDVDGLVWNMLGSSKNLVPTYVATVRQFESYIRRIRSLDTDFKVAIVTQNDDPDENELAVAVIPALRFNGKSFAENELAGNAVRVDNASPTLVNTVVALKPNLVLSFMKDRFTQLDGIAHSIDKLVNPRPYFLLSPWNSASEASLRTVFEREAQAAQPAPWSRYFGIDAASALAPDALDVKYEYQSRLRGTYPGDLANFENFYDSFYYLAFAMYAGGAPITSSSTALGMRRLVDGTKACYVGPSSISDTFTQLQSYESVSLIGALGKPNFDQWGGRIATGSIYCFDDVMSLRPSVFGYDAATDALYATTSAPPCGGDFLK